MEVLKSRGAITSLIRAVCEEQGISNHIITNVKTNPTGEGFVGEIFMVTVKDLDSNKHLEMVIKAAFLDQNIREKFRVSSSFQNEIYFYTKLYPLYRKLENQHAISESDFVPRCLKVSVKKDQQEILALENLNSSGFQLFDKKSILDDAHMRLILKMYGRFHGCSLAFNDQQPEEYQRVTKSFCDVYEEFGNQSFWWDYMLEISKLVQGTLIPGEDDEIIKKFEKYNGEGMNRIFGQITREKVEHSAILHGDGWTNNMLFKYEETIDGRRPIEVRLIDWQLLTVGTPVFDLSYCIYSGASRRIFDSLKDYLLVYHEALSKQIISLGSDPRKLFPFSVLEEHWRQYARWGMIIAVQALKLKLLKGNAGSTGGYDADEVAESFFHPKFDEESYRERVRELLWHMHEIDAL